MKNFLKGLTFILLTGILVSCSKDEAPMPQDPLPPGLEEGPSSQRLSKHIKGSKNPDLGFWEYLPVGYGNTQLRPLMLVFHGVGENGDGGETDLDKVLKHGPLRHVSRDEWPLAGSSVGDEFIILSMQNDRSCPTPETIDSFMRWAIEQYDVDIKRVYLTGLSCGAIGVWNYMRVNIEDDIVAAIVPIAGNGKPAWNTLQCNLGVVPVWAFHGDMDRSVTTDGTLVPLDGLSTCTDPSPIDAIKTIYPGVGHNSWTRTYDLSEGHDIYAWMLSHTNEDAVL